MVARLTARALQNTMDRDVMSETTLETTIRKQADSATYPGASDPMDV
jgi:hypothetical protein